MKLTIENATMIKLGDVVKFSWLDTNNEAVSRTGVVYGNDDHGIKCNCEDDSNFGFGRPLFDGHIDFEVLSDHAPVAVYGMVYDFVSKHQ